MKNPAIQNPSDKLTTLLVAYNLCRDALDHERVLKDYVTESMFHAGIIAYYSIFKDKNDKKWLEDTLLARNLPVGSILYINPGHVKEGQNVGRYYLDIFKKFEVIRDKNIAHKDPERFPENKRDILRIPDGVAGSDVIDGVSTYMTTHSMFLSLDGEDKREFLNLVVASIDILWQKEGLKIHRRGPDGKMYSVDPPRCAFIDNENL